MNINEKNCKIDDSNYFELININSIIVNRKADNTFEIKGSVLNSGVQNKSKKRIKSSDELEKRKELYWTADTKLCLLRPDRQNYFLDILNDAIANKCNTNDDGFIELTCSTKAKYFVHHNTLESLNDLTLYNPTNSNTSEYSKFANVLQSQIELDLLLTRNISEKQRPILFAHKHLIFCRKQIVFSGFLSAYFGNLCKSKLFTVNVPNFQDGTFEHKQYYGIPLRHCKFIGYDHLQGSLKNLLGYISNVIYNESDSGNKVSQEWEKHVLNAYDKINAKLIDKREDAITSDLVQKIIALTSGAIIVTAYKRKILSNYETKLNWSEEFLLKLQEYVESTMSKFKLDSSKISDNIIHYVIKSIIELKKRDSKNKSKKHNDEYDNIDDKNLKKAKK